MEDRQAVLRNKPIFPGVRRTRSADTGGSLRAQGGHLHFGTDPSQVHCPQGQKDRGPSQCCPSVTEPSPRTTELGVGVTCAGQGQGGGGLLPAQQVSQVVWSRPARTTPDDFPLPTCPSPGRPPPAISSLSVSMAVSAFVPSPLPFLPPGRPTPVPSDSGRSVPGAHASGSAVRQFILCIGFDVHVRSYGVCLPLSALLRLA